MRLRVNDNVQIHKVEVEMNSEHFSLLSLSKLKRDYCGDDNNILAETTSNLLHSYNPLLSIDENSDETQKYFSTCILFYLKI